MCIRDSLKWDDHIKHTVSGCYATLSILRKLKYIAKYELRKQLAETLILSKLDYADLVSFTFYHNSYFAVCNGFNLLPQVLYSVTMNFRDLLTIGWLPTKEKRYLNLLKSCFKALHNTETWPDYLKIIKQECRKELRSSNSIKLVKSRPKTAHSKIMRRSYLTIYQKLIGNCKDYRTFLRLSRNFFSLTEYRVIS